MPGALSHSPADVVRAVLIAVGQGIAPITTSLVRTPWQIYVSSEPNEPDNVLTVYDTQGRSTHRTHPDGEMQEHHGIQIRIRAAMHTTGYAKARAIAVALDEQVYQTVVSVEGVSYKVHSISRVGDVIALGMEVPKSKRSLFTVNALASLRQRS